VKVTLLESVLEVSGQTERERDECNAGHRDISASDSTQTTGVKRVPHGDVAIDCQQHRQPDTQQTEKVNSWIHPRKHASEDSDVPRRPDITE